LLTEKGNKDVCHSWLGVLPWAGMIRSDARRHNTVNLSFYAPSFALSKLAYSYYGIGHTNRRQPGDMRGTVIGKQGRFKAPSRRERR
jgi:hypothetical protein